jgi:hypothetical protein
MERIQQSYIRDDAGAKLLYIFRLKLQSFPRPPRLLTPRFGIGVQLLILFQCLLQFVKNIATSFSYVV